MTMRWPIIVLLLLPIGVLAQDAAKQPQPISPLMQAILKDQRPKDIPEEQWLQMMEKPVNRSLYSIRITPAMLDTIDATLLDRRFQYVMVRD